ncbi:MAG: hypothetical protein V3T16_01160 [Gemmatimonadales bacterium]
MARLSLARLRRAVVQQGFTPATWIPEASEGRAAESTVRPARLVEGETLTTYPVGRPEPCPHPLAFLDGIQRYEIVGYLGSAPLLVADIAAAVRERVGRRPRLAVMEHRRLAFGGPEVLERVAGVMGAGAEAGAGAVEVTPVPLADDVLGHPIREIQAARKAIDRARGALELEVGQRFRAQSDAWLIVDGALSEGISWATDPRMIGVSKSHSSLPFAGADQVTYLRTPHGHRTSVFEPVTRALAPVYSWALRLWPWEGRDLFHGLVRVETRASDEVLDTVDTISRWLLAERAPLSAPDPRWDRLLYGIHEVESFLRARVA